ncbi:MAG: type VI secretion system contractile sheath large subunit [Alcanivorax sp.]|nr:type VI secretion system contractile sheath large subunit [Alcanivorax sp.]
MSTQQNNAAAQTVKIEEEGIYERLCGMVDIAPVEERVELKTFHHSDNLAEVPLEKRLTAALQVFLDLASRGDRFERIDKTLLDQYIARIDSAISAQLDAVMHHADFQRVESAWTSLKFLVDRADPKANIRVELLDACKDDLAEDFEDAPDVTQSGLFNHLYVQEYDTPGGEPMSAVISNFEFDCSAPDVSLLTEISRVAAASHCPFLGSVGSKFFGKNSIEEVPKIQDISSYLDKAEYTRWRSFRESEDARYVGLVMPRFLLRLPYGESNPVRSFNYEESVAGPDHEKYLWGNATFAFASNMARSFKQYGWTVNIRGPEAGGKLENLPLHHYDVGRGTQAKIPTEILISETRELEFAEEGFIPLSFYKNSDYACFFSANSSQKPAEYTTKEATANSRINSRLPYIFLVSRLAHYLKVLQRENIGASKSRQELENELNDWLQGLVTKMNNPDPELVANYPLQDGYVGVKEIPENPGYYKVDMAVMPHFQIEGVDVRLSLVSQLPAGKD